MSDYRTEAPEILRDFLSYHETIKAHSQRTVDEYYLDLRNFFRYMKQIRDPDLAGSSIGRICHHHRHGSRILPGNARDEAESVGGDTE